MSAGAPRGTTHRARVADCPRCHGDHGTLPFEIQGDAFAWTLALATCPATGERISLTRDLSCYMAC